MKPTIGRKVWYWPTPETLQSEGWHEPYASCGQPFDATVIYVDPVTGNPNLHIIDWIGDTDLVTACEQTTPEAKEPGKWSWMPYQLAQAAKAEDGK